MPPSPGKIQALPIKVLYTIDTSPQSYLTVLPDKQDVYVHPVSGTDLVGSVALKCLAKGICYASPECVPNRTSLDFTVYNLEPLRAPAVSRAFPSPSTPPPAAAWTGRGFLSWALAEGGAGNTLARGRLVREYEFSPACFSDGGGLEGLMAAARTEDADGKGWGLEVTLTLRQLNPEGKAEFSGRREFENMLAGGKSSASAPLAVTASPRGDKFVRPALPKSPKPPSPLRRNGHAAHHANGHTNAFAGPSSRRPPPSPSPVKTVKWERERLREITPPPKRDRETTPPPKAAIIPQTPPTPSPSRARIMDMLKSEASMSPNMAKKLAGNPFLVKLLKTLPESDSPQPPGPSRSGPGAGLDKPASDDGKCENCGATQSEQWLKKRVKGNRDARVCLSCGLYYNQHKTLPTSSTPAAIPVRSSPRLNRTRADPPPTESPRKRRKPIPSPSPRMATRASTRTGGVKEDGDEATTPTPGGLPSSSLDFGSHFPFDNLGADGVGAGQGSTANGEEQDLSSLFLDFQEEMPSAGVNLFGTHDTNDILEMLRSLDSESGGVGVSQSEP